MNNIAELCKICSVLTDRDMDIIREKADHLQMIADICGADVFIDCPLPDQGAALVVAQAHPITANSLYKSSVVGQLAYANNEPAVLFCLHTGQPVIGSRGISQEHIAMQQNVVPIRNAEGEIIGVLIMEQDISDKVEQEKNVELLMETTEKLSETLLEVAMSEGKVSALMHEGIILFDHRYQITYVNARAQSLLEITGHPGPTKGQETDQLFMGKFSKEQLLLQGGMISDEIELGNYCLQLKAVSIYRGQRAVGGLILLRDISDLKEKEKQLMIKSAVIKEIHHRVKNNLQTVTSLLRMQMRRTDSEEVKSVYRDSINRIGSIAMIHEMLAYDGLDFIDFREVIERIAKNIVSSMARPGQTVHISVSSESLPLPSSRAMTLALIVNELLQNCVVHAFSDMPAGNIDINLSRSGQMIGLQVKDNGKGMGNTWSQTGRQHLGLKIVETLVRDDLSGTLAINDISQPESGTDVHITFPLQKGE